MFIERLINQGNAPLTEQVMRFTSARHKLLLENVANASTPGYRMKDLDVVAFQHELRQRVQMRREAPPGSVAFDDLRQFADDPFSPTSNLLFHDENNRSMETLMADAAKNALLHNLAVELLRKQFGSLENALRERLS
jgi:flagellar basal-body rod protein FlgB